MIRGPLFGHSRREPDTGLLPDNPIEQVFARWTWAGARLAFLWIAIAFVLYLSDLLPPLLPIPEVERQFHLSASKFSAETGAPRGWAWSENLAYGDVLCLAGLVFTVAVIGLAYLAILTILIRRRDWIYAALSAAQALVFLWAALATAG